ncbi:Coenzyme F420 hydrogenase/dehydrogenase, beta subunit C-terminal domain [Marisediminicola sp. LYQ134]|uniref:Coenzyme F420 hydrogenase/dehydrogenase, beta subunit C-terminal domain n=1 Tax=Marisediminicola sp. LYQ134 TaxID=3391061 RepID=UPI003982DD0A
MTLSTSIDEVVANGACIGCGGCSTATDGRIPVVLGTRGQYVADLTGVSDADRAIGSRVCPFADESQNEDEISTDLYPELPHDGRIGRHDTSFAGRVLNDGAVEKSSSGGLTTWLLTKLLESDSVDGVIHVGDTDNPLFGYVVSRSVDDLRAARKSKYYPASFAEAVRSVKGDGLRYAFVGIPCAVRSIRLVMKDDAELAGQVRYAIGILCGHLKSTAYAESFAWQLGVEPANIETVDFRIKNRELTSRQYEFGVQDKRDHQWRATQTLDLVGGSWGHAVFQPEACNYCDDVFAETADVVIGDAWLSKYEIDWRGTNVVVTRTPELSAIFARGHGDGEIMHDDLDVESTARTQAGNFRHRRDGLAVRLADDDAAGRWHPKKRVQPGYPVPPERVELIRERRALSAMSHDAFARAKAAGDLSVYLDAVLPLIDKYQSGTRMSFVVRVRNKLKRESWKLLGRARALVQRRSRGAE